MKSSTKHKLVAYQVWTDDNPREEAPFLLDTVFFQSDMSLFQVKNSLINHDGFPETIILLKARKDGSFPNFQVGAL